MSAYFLRLDDACEKRNVGKWDRMEELLDAYGIKPIVGIIPHCQDKEMECYPVDMDFWKRAIVWQSKGWHIAMHGYDHVYITESGGLNPVNKKSEFAGVPLRVQKEKIRKGIAIMHKHGLKPEIFFAPAHTFDNNTLQAILSESSIRMISDTIANDVYHNGAGLAFIPQQAGRVRGLPFRVVTFCYHPNIMENKDFTELEYFLRKYWGFFVAALPDANNRRTNLYDKLLKWLYFVRR